MTTVPPASPRTVLGTIADVLRMRPADRRFAEREIPWPIAIVAALTGLAAVLRFTRIGHQTFWFDETVTAQLVHLSPRGMLRALPRSESTPPLYYCLAWVWARVFGYGEVGLRSLSALAGVATVPAVYAGAAKLVSRRAGIVAAALAACNPLLIWYSQEARSYELLVLLAALSLCAFAYAREQPTAWRLAAWFISSGLALATHYYAALTVAPEALWLLAIHRRERPVQLAVAGLGACGLGLLALALSQTGKSYWIRLIPLGERLGQVPRQFLIGTGAPAAWVLIGVGTAVVVLALILVAWRADASERRGARVAAGLFAGGVALNAALIAGGTDNLITRNVIVLWLPVAVVVAAGLGAKRARLLGAAGTATLCAVGAAAAIGVAADSNLQRPDWRSVARALGPPPAAGAAAGRAILIQRNLVQLWRYMPGVQFIGRQGAVVDELDVVASSSPHQRACWWGAACMLVPSALPRTLQVPGLHISGPVLHVQQFSLLRFKSPRALRLTPRMLARALTTTTLPADLLFVQLPPCRAGARSPRPTAPVLPAQTPVRCTKG